MMPARKTPQELMTENQGLVRSLAKRIHRTMPAHVELDDLVAYGQAGLAEAAQSYNPQGGSQFATYAYYRVRGAIYDGLSKMNWFSRSQYQQMRQRQLAAETQAVDSANAADPGSTTLQDDVQWLKRQSHSLGVVYLLSQSSDDEQSAAGELADPSAATPPAELAKREVAAKLHQLLDELPEEAATLVRAVYFEGLTIQEAGQRIGVSKAWASRLHARTLERLARSLRRVGVSDEE